MPYEYLECTSNPPRILHIPGFLALECSSNVVGTYGRNIQNAVRIQSKYLECASTAVRIRLDCYPNNAQSLATTKNQQIKFQQPATFLCECIQRITVCVLLRMRSKCFECCQNIVRLFRMQSKCSQNTLQMLFDKYSTANAPQQF